MAIQFEAARQKIDPTFVAAAAGLSDAYYGFWRNGVSHPWNGLDLLDKAGFDKVHGALWHMREQALVAEIEAGSYGYDRAEYDPIIDLETGKRLSEVAADRLAELEASDRGMSDALKAAVSG